MYFQRMSLHTIYISLAGQLTWYAWFFVIHASSRVWHRSSGIFLGLIWGQIWASSQFKNEQKLPKMVLIIPNFLVLHCGENLMKIWTKIAKLQIHENLHKNVNENMFSFTFLCKFSLILWRSINMLQLYTANYNPFKISINFSNFDGPNIYFPISTGPQSQLQNGRKIPEVQISVCQVCSSISLSTIYINVCFSAALIAVRQTSAYASSMHCDLLTYISRSSASDINLQGAQWLTCHLMVAGLSLIEGTVLCPWARPFILSLKPGNMSTWLKNGG